MFHAASRHVLAILPYALSLKQIASVQIGLHNEGRCFLTGDLFKEASSLNGPGFLTQSPGTGRYRFLASSLRSYFVIVRRQHWPAGPYECYATEAWKALPQEARQPLAFMRSQALAGPRTVKHL